jgi:tetratricopeptide (TPR) repeat protein
MSNHPAKLVPRSVLVVLLALTIAAVAAFAAVSHLVARFNANQQARGRKLFAQGLNDMNVGNPGRAVEEFRAALACDRGNPQYQLSLGRALRDTGRLEEAESYLLALGQRTPEDGTINLALARVAALRGSLDDAIRYYHNAMYGVWASDADANGRIARVELVEFLLRKNARAQARAELLALAASLPPDPELHLETAQLLTQARDYPTALSEYEKAAMLDRGNAVALAGAGEAAYRAGRYRSAEPYLQAAVNADPRDSNSRTLLESARLVLEADPFVRHISDAERNRRITADFTSAGERLASCAHQKGVDLAAAPANPDGSSSSPTTALATLESRWQMRKSDLLKLRAPGETDLPDAIMDLVFQIERQTAQDCGEPQGLDEPLLLISRDREAADQ